ncbi:hypothetical protein [Hyphomonas sp.]|uniref:hypothetical protein n=2 Tax=Hyphomonas sp. TaxID=87 RepID=UPI0025BA0AA7|nr:hypothetical protein [Hyphomonas sp.]
MLLAWAGLMIAGAMVCPAVLVVMLIGTIGTVSVYRAINIEKRKLRCACFGGDSDVPLDFGPLPQKKKMVAMAVWILAK